VFAPRFATLATIGSLHRGHAGADDERHRDDVLKDRREHVNALMDDHTAHVGHRGDGRCWCESCREKVETEETDRRDGSGASRDIR
jgi:hypothetical protein